MSFYRPCPLAILIGLLFYGCSPDSNLTWHKEDNYKWAEISPGYWSSAGFSEVSASTSNISFENHLTEEEIIENRHLLNGSGVATGDIDGDGLTDVYFANLNGSNKMGRRLAFDLTYAIGRDRR